MSRSAETVSSWRWHCGGDKQAGRGRGGRTVGTVGTVGGCRLAPCRRAGLAAPSASGKSWGGWHCISSQALGAPLSAPSLTQ